jgi:SAM domain (Sterile alpha motif)
VATITEWLASLGMSEYAQRFTENGIDVSVLRYLTDQDLEKIGVNRHDRVSAHNAILWRLSQAWCCVWV